MTIDKYLYGVFIMFLIYSSILIFGFKVNPWISLGVAGLVAFMNYRAIKKHSTSVEAYVDVMFKKKKKE